MDVCRLMAALSQFLWIVVKRILVGVARDPLNIIQFNIMSVFSVQYYCMINLLLLARLFIHFLLLLGTLCTKMIPTAINERNLL